ncbi:MAG: translocation/assembly module TamB domain-containing protein [Deltaproteobacteria bacterium]|nr:translocation/assembly module TamB domain-containing protein [Deltaproteobacteria bacterium]
MGDDDKIGQEDVTRSIPAVAGTPDSGVHRRPTNPYQSKPDLPMPPVEADKPSHGDDGKKKKEKKPKKKRSVGFRIFKGFLWFLFIVVVVIPTLALIFFSLPPGKSVARGLLEGVIAGSVNGTVKLEKLDYSIFGGELEIGGLEIADPDGNKVVSVGKVFVGIDFLSLVSAPIDIDKLLVDGVRLNIEQFADGTSNLTRLSKKPLQLGGKALVIEDIEVKDVSVTIKTPTGKLALANIGITGKADLDRANNKVDVTLNRFAVDVGVENERMKLTLPFATGLALQQTGERTVKVAVTPEPTTIVVERKDLPTINLPLSFGRIGATLDGGVMDTAIEQVAAGPLTIEAIAAHGALPPPGQLGIGPGEHSLAVRGVRVTGEGVNETLGQELLATDVGLDFGVKGPAEKMVIDGKVDTAGGKLALSGWVDVRDLLNPIYEIVLTGDGIDTTKLLLHPQEAVTTALKVTAKGKGILPGSLDAGVHIEVGPTTVAGKVVDLLRADVILKGQLVRLENAVITAFGQDARLDAQIDRGTREFASRFRLESKVGQTIENARQAGVLILPLPPIEGDLSVDLDAHGRLKPEGAAQAEVAGVKRSIFEQLPVEEVFIKGTVTGKQVKVAERSVGALDIKADVGLKDFQPQGTVTAAVRDIDTGTMKVGAVDLDVILEGMTQKIHLVVNDEPQALAVETRATSTLDLEQRRATVVVEQLDVKRGAFETKLEAPVTAVIDQSADPGGGLQHVTLQPARLLLASGALSVAADVGFSRDPEKPGASKVDAMTVALDLDRLSIGKLAALARKNTKGLGGTISGSARIGGTPADPVVDFGVNVKGRMKTGAPFTLLADGALKDQKLELRAAVKDDQRTPLASLDVFAPLSLPKPGEPGETAKKPGLAPGGRLKIDLEIPRTTFARLGKLSPNPLPDAVDPDGTIEAELHLTGSPARPTGDWELALEGGFLRRRGYERAPADQKVTVKGSLRPPGRGETMVALVNRLAVFLDADAATPTIDHTLDGGFKRSPLLPNPLGATWSLNGRVAPIQLAPLHEAGLAKQALAGALTHTLALAGQGQDVGGTIALGFEDVKVGDNPAATGATTITVGHDDTRIASLVKVGGADALRTDIAAGVPGRGLRAFIKNRTKLMAAPVSGTIELVDRTLADWRTIIAKVPALPGKVGGKLTLGGTLQTPEAQGGFGWDDFETAAGTPGRIGLELDANAKTAGGGLVVGPGRDIVIGATVERAALPGKGPLPVAFQARADKVDLLRLIPAFVAAGKPLEVKGLVDMNMDGRLVLGRDPDAGVQGLQPSSTLGGDLVVSGLDVVVPDTDRHIQDGRLRIVASPSAITLDGLHVREADMQRQDRTADVTGQLTLVGWKPGVASLTIKTKEWLIGGLGFDGPEGELDADIAIDVRGLTDAVKVVDVTINALDLHGPERFVRAHYPQFVSYGDVIYTDESGRPAGKLPAPAGSVAKAGAAATVADVPADPSLPTAPAPAPLAVDAHIKIPNPIRVSASIPIDVKLQGGLDVTVRGKDIQAKGRIDVVEGVLGAMGRDFVLEEGAIVADGGLDTLKAEIHFAHVPHAVALRDFALPEGTYDKARITVFFTLATGQKTYFSGIPGPHLLDMATILNHGRTRLWGGPDVIPSETVRFGNGDHALVVTFVQTNLRNLIFMDRFNGWSESLEDPSTYGRLAHYDMQRFVGGGRWRLVARPPEPGQNRMELGYDWLLADSPRTVVGFGPHFGLDLELGLGLTVDWSSQE